MPSRSICARTSSDCDSARWRTRSLTAVKSILRDEKSGRRPMSSARRMSVRTPVAAMNAFDGTQSYRTEEPPMPASSTTVTSAPYLAPTSAAS